MVFSNDVNIVIQYLTLFMSIIQPLSYILVSTTDPGVIIPGQRKLIIED